jgi:hypothetical protein
MTAEWRKYATPEELAAHDGSIAKGASDRRKIRNTCRNRGKRLLADKETGK